MKQSDQDKELRLQVKAEAKARRWKSIGATQYWTVGPLFFCLHVVSSAKEGSFYGALHFKWLELDKMLWRVLGMSENEQQPLSFHANGAFALPGWELQSTLLTNINWSSVSLAENVSAISESAAAKAMEVISQVKSLDDYLGVLKKEHAKLMVEHPRAAIDTYKEQVLSALMVGDHEAAAALAEGRIAAGDFGGYVVNGQSFYQRALDFCADRGLA